MPDSQFAALTEMVAWDDGAALQFLQCLVVALWLLLALWPWIKAFPTHWLPTLPRFLDLFKYLFGHDVRERVYQPAADDLTQDYFEARQKYRTMWARRWLAFCFTIRAILLALETMRVAWIMNPLFKLVPARLKHLFIQNLF